MIPDDLKSYYKLHSRFYDITRWAFLFGRNSILTYLPNLGAGTRVLDLGCGTGKHLNQLRKKYPESEIIGLDQAQEMLGFVNHIVADSVQLKNKNYSLELFKENSFDLILCSYSLTMFKGIDEAIQNIKAHLKPSGSLLVVDFDSTTFNWFSKWMKRNHVSFEPNLFKLLERNFDVELKKTRKCWFGVYTYSILLSNNPS